jgi:hypothetical protein
VFLHERFRVFSSKNRVEKKMIYKNDADDDESKDRDFTIFKKGFRNHTVFRDGRILLMVVILFLSVGCAHHIPIATDSVQAIYMAPENEKSVLHRFAPGFRVYDYNYRYNRIGSPVAERKEDGEEQISIDTNHPVIYVGEKLLLETCW